MIAETDREDLVLRAEDLLQEEFDVLGVPLKEFALRVGDVDEQADAERQFGFAGEGDDLLRDAVFEDPKGILVEPRDELAGGVVDAEGERYKVDFGMEDGLLGSPAGSREDERWKQGDSKSAEGRAAWA